MFSMPAIPSGRVVFTTLLLFALVSAMMAGEGNPLSAAAPQASDPLVQVLAAKGILTSDEAYTLSNLPAGQQREGLVRLLKEKGILTEADVRGLQNSNGRLVEYSPSASSPSLRPAVLTTVAAVSSSAPAAAPEVKPPAVIAAVAPLRVLQNEPSKPGGLVPDIKLGSKANMKIYGLFKASAIYDSSSPSGTDMPLPGFAYDTGPSGAPEFHVKARFFRIGSQFEWPDISPKLSLTGRVEADFEGDFTRVLNRNISTIRSSMFSIRLAWARLDYAATDKTSVHVLFGQDWTPFGSSTLPALFETTGLGLGFGTLYERAPQFRFGLDHKLGGDRKWMISPEVAIVMPAYGNDPSNVADQLGYGERQGADAARPDVQGRLVTQFQLDKAPGVAPAQVIVSFVEGSRRALVTAASVPAAYQAAFPRGAEVSSDRWGYTGEIQLPTRYVTLLTKYWRGADLRWFFVGDLRSVYTDAAGLTKTAFGSGIDGPAAASCTVGVANCVLFGLNAAGQPVAAPQRPLRSQGGFVNLGFPLGRIFGAEPGGRNAGWQLYLHYAYDGLYARDARRLGNIGSRNDLAASTLLYKLNSLVSFTYEYSMYRTRTVNSPVPGKAPFFRGLAARSWEDLRSEWGTTFTF